MAKKTCPKCGGRRIPILYGMPTSEAAKDEREGKVIIGGCTIVPGYSPKYQCRDCGCEFGRVGVADDFEGGGG